MSFAKSSDGLWKAAPSVVSPPKRDEVFVWRIALANVSDADESQLSADERERADRFRFPEVRRAFVQGRLFLRRILARTLQGDPAALRFGLEGNGKPKLDGFDLAFNLSHSGGQALCAIAGTGPVGVDVETASPSRDLMGLARRYFASDEFESLQSLPDEERMAAFYRCWTRKEAFIKAIGEGLSRPLDSFSVEFRTGVAARFLRIGLDPEEPRRWRLCDLDPGSGFAAALVVPSAVTNDECFMLDAL
jgi:4'-phosphopantetheinyl transferase